MPTDPWAVFVTASIIALAGSAVRGMFKIIESLKTMSKNINQLTISVELLSNADSKHMQAIGAIAKLQRPQLAAHKATLEALQDGKCNGNVKDAKAQIVAAFDEYDEFLVGRL
jgi:hypothetical protein